MTTTSELQTAPGTERTARGQLIAGLFVALLLIGVALAIDRSETSTSGRTAAIARVDSEAPEPASASALLDGTAFQAAIDHALTNATPASALLDGTAFQAAIDHAVAAAG